MHNLKLLARCSGPRGSVKNFRAAAPVAMPSASKLSRQDANKVSVIISIVSLASVSEHVCFLLPLPAPTRDTCFAVSALCFLSSDIGPPHHPGHHNSPRLVQPLVLFSFSLHSVRSGKNALVNSMLVALHDALVFPSVKYFSIPALVFYGKYQCQQPVSLLPGSSRGGLRGGSPRSPSRGLCSRRF